MTPTRRQFLQTSVTAASAVTALGAASRATKPATVDGQKRPNVLWLISEDMGQQLGCYGFPIRTPNVDRLAREGTQFQRAFCSSPICSPSRSAFTTGMYATTIGAHNHRTAPEDKQPLPEGVKIAPEWFKQAGYHTCIPGSTKTDWNFVHAGDTGNKAGPDGAYDSLDWSDRKPGQPFFAMLNFGEPHRYVWGGWDDLAFHHDPDTVPVPPIYPDLPIMRQNVAKYMDFIVEMDRKLGLVLDRLEAEGELDNTIIFYFGDNGRTIYRGKQWLYDEGLSVPLIARHPDWFAPGSINDDLVSLIDVLPTSLSLIGQRVPEAMQGRVLVGDDRTEPADYVFASRDTSDTIPDLIRSVRDKRYKYIRNDRPELAYPGSPYVKAKHPEWTEAYDAYVSGRLTEAQSAYFADAKPPVELYDIQADPYEVHNLATDPAHAPVAKRLKAALETWIKESGDVVLAGK